MEKNLKNMTAEELKKILGGVSTGQTSNLDVCDSSCLAKCSPGCQRTQQNPGHCTIQSNL